jgi:biopolymer transport protein ExbB
VTGLGADGLVERRGAAAGASAPEAKENDVMRNRSAGWMGVAVGLLVLAASFGPPCWDAAGASADARALAAEKQRQAQADAAPFRVDAAWATLKNRFIAGGGTMWAILAASTIGLASFLERMFRLTRRSFIPRGFTAKVDELWHAGKFDEIEKLAARHRNSTLAKIVSFITRQRDADIDIINEAISDIAGRDFTTHQMFAYPMVAIATICPLFGLMGTVIGIIDTFEMVAIAGAMGDPSIMAAGISKALVCTAFGLVVAIPMLFIYHIIKLRTQYFNRLLEEDACFLVESWLIKRKVVRQ